jgi:hypothetical protein
MAKTAEPDESEPTCNCYIRKEEGVVGEDSSCKYSKSEENEPNEEASGGASDDGAGEKTEEAAGDNTNEAQGDDNDEEEEDGSEDGAEEGSEDGAEDGSDNGAEDGSDDGGGDRSDDGSADGSEDGGDDSESGEQCNERTDGGEFDDSGEAEGQTEVIEYERLRGLKVKANEAYLETLGLVHIASTLPHGGPRARKGRENPKPPTPTKPLATPKSRARHRQPASEE